jgi:hypothetical protein
MNKIRYVVSNIILAIAAIIIIMLLVRLIFDALGLNIAIVYSITDGVFAPFSGAWPERVFGLNPNILLAIVSYALLGLLAEQIITTPLQTSFGNIILEVFKSIFRIVEYVLFYRFALMFLGAGSLSTFVAFIYNLTAGADMLLRTYVIDLGPFKLEVITLALFSIALVVDAFLENLLERVFGDITRAEKFQFITRKETVTTSY